MYVGVVICEFQGAVGTPTEGNAAEETRVPTLHVVISVLARKGLHSRFDIIAARKFGAEIRFVKFKLEGAVGIVSRLAVKLRGGEYPKIRA